MKREMSEAVSCFDLNFEKILNENLSNDDVYWVCSLNLNNEQKIVLSLCVSNACVTNCCVPYLSNKIKSSIDLRDDVTLIEYVSKNIFEYIDVSILNEEQIYEVQTWIKIEYSSMNALLETCYTSDVNLSINKTDSFPEFYKCVNENCYFYGIKEIPSTLIQCENKTMSLRKYLKRYDCSSNLFLDILSKLYNKKKE